MKVLRLSVFILVLGLAVPAFAEKIYESGEKTLNIGLLMQSWMTVTQKGAQNKDDWGTDFYLRRARLIVNGTLTKDIAFFFETDQANFGKGGAWDQPMFVQDAFATFRFADEFMLDAGMIILPFSHQGVQGATSLNTLDYHTALMKYPGLGLKVWRDAGVQFRGYLMDSRLSYRVGVFNGMKGVNKIKDAAGTEVSIGVNPKDMPRVTGMVRYNIMGTEDNFGSFFLKGLYFSDKPIISVGVSGDFQKDGINLSSDPAKADLKAYWAVAGDVFVEYPLADSQEIVGQVAFYQYSQGEKALNTGMGILGEVGYRFRQIEPVVAVDMFMSDAADSDFQSIRGGVNYWIAKHNASIKLDVASSKQGKADRVLTTTLQAQLLF